MTERGIDHLVLCVGDLEAARSRYAAMGFTLCPSARHPFGTGNANIQMHGAFLELLTVLAPEDIPDHGKNRFSFAAFNRDFLARREGFSMLVLTSADARADAEAFAERGLKTYEPFDFQRQQQLPDGSEVTVGFSLAFATDPEIPENAFFCCQQHAPEYFWKPEYQEHANGAQAIAEVVMVASDPEAHRDFFAKLLPEAPQAMEAGRLVVETAHGDILVDTPSGSAARYGEPPKTAPSPPYLAGYTVSVADLDKARAALQEGGLAARRAEDRLIVPADEVFGTAVAFQED